MKNFVDYKWLKSNINREDLIILDIRQGDKSISGIDLYRKGHIKGAQYVGKEVIIDEVKTHGGRSPLPDLEKFLEDMKNLGINDSNLVVIYDQGRIVPAGRLWWMLKYIGKEDVFVLDGGFNKWEKENGEITRELPSVKKSDSLSLNINHSMKIDMEDVRSKIKDDSIAIVDARAYERYTGEVEPLDKIGGHIPSAINHPWEDLIRSDGIISLDEAKENFKDLKDYEEIIVYCGSGISATVDLMLMEEIGLKPKHYVGGYSDWISYEKNQVITKK